MKTIEMPVLRLAARSILRSFQTSNKKHLILTGTRGTGKSFLAKQLAELIAQEELCSIPSVITRAIPRSHVELHSSISRKTSVIGKFVSSAVYQFPDTHLGNRMTPCLSTLRSEGVSAMECLSTSDSPWVLIDELGYLESECTEFQTAVLNLFKEKKVIAVLRKQSTEFLNSILKKQDVFLYDLNQPVLPVGCVIMASGIGQRFGSNKLLADLDGQPMVSHILSITGNHLFADRIVVTRHPEIQALCNAQNIPVILHDFPEQNQTVRLGLSHLLTASCAKSTGKELRGCLFAVGDQPALSRESLETMVLTFSQNYRKNDSSSREFSDILRLCHGSVQGNPVLFGNHYFDELLRLPMLKGGSFLARKYKDQVIGIEASSPDELCDIDTQDDMRDYKKRT